VLNNAVSVPGLIDFIAPQTGEKQLGTACWFCLLARYEWQNILPEGRRGL